MAESLTSTLESGEYDAVSQRYEIAKSFWKWWHEDPDSDQALVCEPSEAIEQTLVERGAHPIEAGLLSRWANDSVLEQRAIERELARAEPYHGQIHRY